jgi:hypothetical protein
MLANHELRWPVVLGIFVLEPGIAVARWFPVKGDMALAVVGAASIGWYSTMFWTVLALAPERGRVRRSVTLPNCLFALAVAAMATLAATALNIASPKIFGLLYVPVSWLDGLVRIFIPGVSDPRGWWWRRMSLLRYVSGCLGYGVIAFVALYWFVWRKGARA